jgi:hypothetical protein
VTDVTTAAGTRFYVSDDEIEQTLDGFNSISDWVEVEQVESIAEFGDEVEDIPVPQIGSNRIEHKKGVHSPVGFNLVVGHDPLDSGQDFLAIANDSIVEFAFKVIIPGEIDAVLFFHALVKSNKLNVGTASDVVRRNYSCTLNSDIITQDNIGHIATFSGAGGMSVHMRQISAAVARLSGDSTLAVYARQRSLVAAKLAGASAFSVEATTHGRIQIDARFAGAGGFLVTATVPGRIPIDARFAGVGGFSADVTVRGIVNADARFAGTGTVQAYARQRSLVAARLAGAGRLTAQAVPSGTVQGAFQANAFQNDAFQVTPEEAFQANAFQNDAFQI